MGAMRRLGGSDTKNGGGGGGASDDGDVRSHNVRSRRASTGVARPPLRDAEMTKTDSFTTASASTHNTEESASGSSDASSFFFAGNRVISALVDSVNGGGGTTRGARASCSSDDASSTSSSFGRGLDLTVLPARLEETSSSNSCSSSLSSTSEEMRTALALHLACSTGAPLEDIEAILTSHPEAVRTAKDYTGVSPTRTLERTALRRCACTFCTVNHQKVALLLRRAERRLENNNNNNNERSPLDRGNSFIDDVSVDDGCGVSCDVDLCHASEHATWADDDDDDSVELSPPRRDGDTTDAATTTTTTTTTCLYDGERRGRHRFSSSTHSATTDDPTSSSPLTHEALTLKNQLDNDLIRRRVHLWTKHAHIFIDLERETKAVLEERRYVLAEYARTREEIRGLHRTIRRDERERSRLRFFARIMRHTAGLRHLTNSAHHHHNDTGDNDHHNNRGGSGSGSNRPTIINRDDVEYSIGIANINISDLERYLVELTERIHSMRRKYQRYHSNIFGETEKLMEHMLGKSAVSGCIMRRRPTSTNDHNIRA